MFVPGHQFLNSKGTRLHDEKELNANPRGVEGQSLHPSTRYIQTINEFKIRVARHHVFRDSRTRGV